MAGNSEIGPSAPTTPAGLVEHFFRHETGRLHGALVRLLGIENLALAEDVAQEAMLRALRIWSMGGVPANPAAWITRVAMNLGRDALRQKRMSTAKEPALVTHLEQTLATPTVDWEAARGIRDDTLRLMFVCCHPDIPVDSQVILALKILGGFSVGEIARAFLSSESAIEKQLTRTKQRIAAAKIPFEFPEGQDLSHRTEGVLGALYLMFNEGHKATAGCELLREDLCREAIRLALVLVAHPSGNTPNTHALLALMMLTAARFPSRVDANGMLLRLDDQDRTKWDQSLIECGLHHLQQAARGGALGEYHLLAGIAAIHALAPDSVSTDWEQILRHYDELSRIKPSPIVSLNRVVALAQVHGTQAALDSLELIPQREKLNSNHLLHAVEGELLWRLGRHAEAAASYRRALELASVGPEQNFLTRVLERTNSQSETGSH